MISRSAEIDAEFDFRQRHTYRGWITRRFGEYEDEKGYDVRKLWVLESLVETIGRIKRECQSLEDWSVVMLGNAYATGEYREVSLIFRIQPVTMNPRQERRGVHE